MPSQNLKAKLLLRNDTAANWVSNNTILSKGEIGIESNTRRFKIGDGITTWNSLAYSNVLPEDLLGLGYGDMTKTVYDPDGDGSVSKADKLSTPRNIAITGDASGNANFDGSANISVALILANTGANAGTYTKLTINSKGIVTGATTLSASDIPSITASKISDLGTAGTKNVGTAVGNVVEVLTGGKIDASLIPAIALTEVFEVANQATMLALSAQMGDVAIRSDENKSYILKASPATNLANWVLLRTPTDTVLSVNSKTGAVTLTTSDIAEGSNLYYTEARATTNFNTNFALKASTSLSDGASIIRTADTLILDGGTATV